MKLTIFDKNLFITKDHFISQECFCGDIIKSPCNESPTCNRLLDSDCSMSCAGNPDEKCGGSYIIMIYEKIGMNLY